MDQLQVAGIDTIVIDIEEQVIVLNACVVSMSWLACESSCRRYLIDASA